MNQVDYKPFEFRQFSIRHDRCTMKVGTDGVLLGAWAPIEGAARVLDIGTGSGVIAIMLAQRLPSAQVEGVEIDPQSAGQASENMRLSPWSDSLRCHQTSFQDFYRQAGANYDLIVSNPPFFTGGTLSENQDRHAVRHAIKLPHGDLLLGVKKLLAPSGRFALILPLMEGTRFRELAESYGLYCRRCTSVRPRPGKPVARLLMGFSQDRGSCLEDEMTLQEESGDERSEAYRSLTADFYL